MGKVSLVAKVMLLPDGETISEPAGLGPELTVAVGSYCAEGHGAGILDAEPRWF
jgi:hypothetical protein